MTAEVHYFRVDLVERLEKIVLARCPTILKCNAVRIVGKADSLAYVATSAAFSFTGRNALNA